MKTASMTQQQKLEKAAELLGFKRHGDSGLWADWNGVLCGYLDGKLTPIPRYDEDLNLMHEAEKVLPEDKLDKYQTMLTNLVEGKPINAYCHWSDVGSTFTVHATASQRLDAWLEVMMEGESCPKKAEAGLPRTAAEGRENLERIQELHKEIFAKLENIITKACSSIPRKP